MKSLKIKDLLDSFDFNYVLSSTGKHKQKGKREDWNENGNLEERLDPIEKILMKNARGVCAEVEGWGVRSYKRCLWRLGWFLIAILINNWEASNWSDENRQAFST